MSPSIGFESQSQRVQRAAVVVALLAIACDMLLVWTRSLHIEDFRGTVAMAAVVLLVGLSGGDSQALGLTCHPRQGWRCWLAWALRFGLGLMAVCLIAALLMWIAQIPLPLVVTPPERILQRLLGMCFVAPLLEEAVYRLILCVGLFHALGKRRTILLSGVLFAALHWLYGNPSPENQLAGFLLAWAYLRSGTILLPILLHAVGNAFALATQVVGWAML